MISFLQGLIVILLSLFFFGHQVVLAADSNLEARQYYERGQAHYQAGRYKEATAEFQKALELAGSAAPYLEYRDDSISSGGKRAVLVKASDEPGLAAGRSRDYHIDIGDVLDIQVWKIPDLSSPEVIVRPDEKISLPLIGDVQAVGLTLTQLDEELTKRFSEYVRQPQVSVMIKKFGGNKVVVLGDVKTPGVYSFSGSIRLMEALALSGDCTKYAVKNNVLVIRGDIHNNPTIISCNVASFLKYAKLSENVPILSQDVVFVPRSAIGNLNSFFETIAPIIDGVYKTSTTDIYIKNARNVMEKTSNVKITQ